jgi:hypothetical protein
VKIAKIRMKDCEIFYELYTSFGPNDLPNLSKKIFQSEYKIIKFLEFDTLGIVLILIDSKTCGNNNNVVCIDYEGTIIWQVENFKEIIDISLIDDKLAKLYNIDGSYYVIKPQNAEVVINPKDSISE